MEFLSLFQRKQKNTQAVSKSNASLERAADSILNQRGKQIVDGLNRTTASTGTPMDKLHGGAKRMAQMSNIGEWDIIGTTRENSSIYAACVA